MLPITQEYMSQCAKRRDEPYYGFIERAGAGEIVTDLDFASLQSVRVFASALLHCGSRSVASKGAKLQVLALRYDSNKGLHHPPRQSKRKLPYATLLAQRLPGEVIVAPQNRPVLRSLICGVRAVCVAYKGHLVRVELSGLPLAHISEVTGRLFDVLQHCSLLRVLKLNKSKLTDGLFIRLTTAVNTFPSLKEAHFSECNLTDNSARGIHSLILLNRSREQNAMWRASLRDMDKGGGGGGHGKALSKGLEALDLSGNRLSDDTLRRLGVAIMHDASLRVVDFSRNVVTTEGLKEFLQQGTLRESAVESLDLSKNLIDTKGKYVVGDCFTCQQAYEEQLLLTRIESHKERQHNDANTTITSTTTIPQPGPRNRTMSPQNSLTIRAPSVDAVGDLVQVRQDAASSQDSDTYSRGAGGDERPYLTSPTVMLNVSEDNVDVSSQLFESSGSGESPARPSTWAVSPENFDPCSTTSYHNESYRTAERPRPFQQKEGTRHEYSPHHHFHHHHHPQQRPQQKPAAQQQQPNHPHHQGQGSTMPFFSPFPFPPVVSTSDDHNKYYCQEQWCGIPLYVPVPLSSLGPVALPTIRKRSTRDAAVGTSPKSEAVRQSNPRSSSVMSVINAAPDPEHENIPGCLGSGTDEGSAFEKMMLEPMQSTEWDIAEWRKNEQHFLESLIVRVENHENATTEMLERNYQATCDRLCAIQEEFSRQIHEVLEGQKAESERLRGELREGLLSAEEFCKEENPEDAMAEELAKLIHTGMRRIQSQIERPAASAGGGGGVTTLAAKEGLGEPVHDYLRVVKDRLSSLGW